MEYLLFIKMNKPTEIDKPSSRWSTPHITILIRGNNQESLLLACKGDGGTTSEQGLFDGCWMVDAYGEVPCNAIGTS